MNLDYEVNRKMIYSLEWIRSEMQLKLFEVIAKNPKFESETPNQKINAIGEVQEYLEDIFHVIEQAKKNIQQKDLLISKLQSELNLKNQ
jgi:hypothetical protein